MIKSKNIIMAALLITASNMVFAEGNEPPQNKEMLDKAKSEMLSNMEKRQELIATDKSCIQSAQSKEELKNCVKNAKAGRESLREEMKANRKERHEEMKAERQERREDRKENHQNHEGHDKP